MNEERWIEAVRAKLDAQVDGYDGATRSRLTRARAAAVDRLARPRRLPPLAAPALAASIVAAVLAIGLWREPAVVPPDASERPSPLAEVLQPDRALADAADLDILAAEPDLDLLADLEFYLWLEGALPPAEAG